ncbi:MAG TPA: hypothetical protein VHP36_03190 [Chitinispirillaceae bacterium]|nr:hypothetical protein [Chitinispirillaceae bacterium]
MSLNGVESSGRTYAGQVGNKQPAEKTSSSEKQDDRVRENSNSQEERRTSEPGRGENMDVTG